MRLDRYLSEKGLVQSRNKAAELIEEGSVWVNDRVEYKASAWITQDDTITIRSMTPYVSRAGLKLRRFLNEITLHVDNLDVLDIGSSTGGFVQVWLEEGAKCVTAVDVGSEQLHPLLREDVRIQLHEQTDIRSFQAQQDYDVVSCDVSFIGVGPLLETIDRLARHTIVILFKPQFEVGRSVRRTAKGVVKDSSAIIRAQQHFETHAIQLGWHLCVKKDSLLKGKEGNVETFYYFTKRPC